LYGLHHLLHFPFGDDIDFLKTIKPLKGDLQDLNKVAQKVLGVSIYEITGVF